MLLTRRTMLAGTAMLAAYPALSPQIARAEVVITAEEFVKLAAAWMHDNETDIDIMIAKKGGWELWTRDTLYAYFKKKDVAVALEVSEVYEPQKQDGKDKPKKLIADFVINTKQSDKSKLVIVEMKNQSAFNATNFSDSRNSFKTDAYALDHSLAADYKKSKRVVLGFYFDDTNIPTGFYKITSKNKKHGMCYIIM